MRDYKSKRLIIHHWDADGICSAALFLKFLDDFDLKIPSIGNYYLKKEEIEEIHSEKYDSIIILDMAMEKESILMLKDISRVSIFDHHLQEEIKGVEHHNPIIRGENAEKYPATSWIVNEHLKNLSLKKKALPKKNYTLYTTIRKETDLLAVLGVIGDWEEKIKEKIFYEKIKKFNENNNLTFNMLLEMAMLLDSSYKIGDREGVMEAPRILACSNDIAKTMLSNIKWNQNMRKLEREIEIQMEKKEKDLGKIILKEIDTPYNIISTIARKIAWENGKIAIVVNRGFFDDFDQVYVRSAGVNMKPLVEMAKKECSAGGKREVMGAVVPKENCDDFLKKVIDNIG